VGTAIVDLKLTAHYLPAFAVGAFDDSSVTVKSGPQDQACPACLLSANNAK